MCGNLDLCSNLDLDAFKVCPRGSCSLVRGGVIGGLIEDTCEALSSCSCALVYIVLVAGAFARLLAAFDICGAAPASSVS